MKRKTLEKLPVPVATNKMVQLVEQDSPQKKLITYTYKPNETIYQYKRYIYFAARIVEESILQIAMYLRKDISKGHLQPRFLIYLDKKRQEFATYIPKLNKWSEAKIDMLEYPKERGELCENIPYADKQTEAIVNDYFETSKQHVKKLVLDFQMECRKNQLQQRHKKETDEVDEVMELVPEVPKDFENWIFEYGFHGDHRIMYHANKRTKQVGYCLRCQNSLVLSKARKGQKIKCPECGVETTLLPWSSSRIRVTRNIGLIQRLSDDSGWVVRRFSALFIADKQEDWKPRAYLSEEVRETYYNDLCYKKHYEFGHYKNTGVNRWSYSANEPNRKGYYRDDFVMGDVRFYWGNIARERKGTVLQYIPLEKVFSRCPGHYMDVHYMMRQLKKHPEVEYFIKMGFKRLSFDILNEKMELLPGKKPWQVLGVSKEIMQKAQKWDVGYRQLKTLREAEELGFRLEKKEMEFYCTYLLGSLGRLFRYSTPHKYYRYFTETFNHEREYGDYMDYLEAAERNQYDMRNEMVLFPKNFREAHDTAIAERQARDAKVAAASVRTQNKEYAKMVPGIKELYEFEDDNFFIKVPEKKADFVSEGHMNNNCVATYFEEVLKGRCVIVFLRKKSEPEKSFCTVEITNIVTVQQLRSRYNGTAPKEAQDFANRWMAEVKKRIAYKEHEDNIAERIPVVCAG